MADNPSTWQRLPDFERLRAKHSIFRFISFEHQRVQDDLVVRFRFSIVGAKSFAPTIILRGMAGQCESLDRRTIDRFLFRLGLIEAISYWKATCSSIVSIECGSLASGEVHWWTNLLIRGMSEFFFRNGLYPLPPDLVTLKVSAEEPAPQMLNSRMATAQRCLLPVGGGRDSALSLAALREAGLPVSVLLLNPTPAAVNVTRQNGVNEVHHVVRVIDPGLLELNAAGYLNGHTPFSAYLAMLSSLVQCLFGYDIAVLANERSADYGNLQVDGVHINHQYSKTFDCETAFDQYLQTYLLCDARYVSLLRPLYELQIARAFAQQVDLLPQFRSCNRTRNQNSWCGACPKCLSVFVTMYPFLDDRQVRLVFGGDWFEDMKCLPIILGLGGATGVKPFECVCTADETQLALLLARRNRVRERAMVPVGLAEAIRLLTSGVDEATLVTTILGGFGVHNLPPKLEEIARSLAARGT